MLSGVAAVSAADILRRAAQLIEDRAAQRDRPDGEKSMLATVNAFNAIYGTTLTETQGWHMLELLKMVRSAYGVYVADDYDDKVAYAALAAEAAVPHPRATIDNPLGLPSTTCTHPRQSLSPMEHPFGHVYQCVDCGARTVK